MEEKIKNELIKKIEQSLNEVKEGKYIPAKEGFEMLRRKYNDDNSLSYMRIRIKESK